MKPVRIIESRAVPLARSDVDTDQIIPSDWLKRVERTGFGAGLFSEWRDGPEFILNNPDYAGAQILLAGPNFGTGSSREHAVWALMDYGFDAVVSPRFGDIFKTNCTKQGLLPVELDEHALEGLMEAVARDPTTLIVIDVDRLTVEAPSAGITASFALDGFVRQRFLNGWDDISLTLLHDEEIAAFETSRPEWTVHVPLSPSSPAGGTAAAANQSPSPAGPG